MEKRFDLPVPSVIDGWKQFFTDYWRECPPGVSALAVTLAYNPHRTGTAGPCVRCDPVTEQPTGAVLSNGVSSRDGSYAVSEARRITTDRTRQDLDRLHQLVDKRIYGSHYNKRGLFERSSFAGVREHPDYNAHIHLVWRTLDNRIDEATVLITSLWSEMISGGSSSVRLVRDTGWPEYVAKTARTLTVDDDLLVLSRRPAR